MGKKVIWAIIAIGIGIYVISGILKSNEQKGATEANKQKIETAIREMAAKYDAATDWMDSLNSKKTIYTIDVQNALINANKRPILFRASLEDVSKLQGQYVVHLDTWVGVVQISFQLQCGDGHVHQMLAKSDRDPWNSFAVVAQIQDINKPLFRVKAVPSDEYSELELESSDTFIALGQCLDFLYIREITP